MISEPTTEIQAFKVLASFPTPQVCLHDRTGLCDQYSDKTRYDFVTNQSEREGNTNLSVKLAVLARGTIIALRQ